MGDDGSTELPIPLALGPAGNVRGDARLLLGYEPLPQAAVVLRQGLRVTTPLRALFDELRGLGLREGVVALDMAMAARLVSVERLREYTDAHGRWRRSTRIRPVLELASEHSRSPRETALRIVWRLDAGLPAPLANCPIHDFDRRLLGVADLLDTEAGLVVEFDGAEHRGAGRHTRDVAKDHSLRQVGLEVTRVTGTDLRDTGLVVRRLCEARHRAAFTPADRRRWQARPPHDDLDAWLDEREAMIRRHEDGELSHVDEGDTL